MLNQDLLLLHGDLFFSREALPRLLKSPHANAVACSLGVGNDRDFRGRLTDGQVACIGVGLDGPDCCSVAPLYKLSPTASGAWLAKVGEYVQLGKVGCYAEEALNSLLPGSMDLMPVDMGWETWFEVDTNEDLARLSDRRRID